MIHRIRKAFVVFISAMMFTCMPLMANAEISSAYVPSEYVPSCSTRQATSGKIIFSNAATQRMYTVQECSVWSAPNSADSKCRVKKVPAAYEVTVYGQKFISPFDNKEYYQTVKGKFILAKCLTPILGDGFRMCGTDKMYAWGRTASGATIYENVALYGTAGAGWPQYLIDELSKSGINDNMSDYEKAVTVAKYLQHLVSYDYTDQTGFAAHTTMGALQNRLAVCQGYANAYSNMMRMCGIECNYVRGTANGGNHGWNKLIIGGVEYYTDVTWNSCLNNQRYLMISFDQMSQDHLYKENRGRTMGDNW